jgi:hypothetical protein
MALSARARNGPPGYFLWQGFRAQIPGWSENSIEGPGELQLGRVCARLFNASMLIPFLFRSSGSWIHRPAGKPPGATSVSYGAMAQSRTSAIVVGFDNQEHPASNLVKNVPPVPHVSVLRQKCYSRAGMSRKRQKCHPNPHVLYT